MNNYLETINYDLNGLIKVLVDGQTTSDFSMVPIFSLFRDACIILFETNKILKEDGLIHSDLQYMDEIKEVRHKVKTNQGFKNREIFNKLLDGHKSVFGNDIDNLGFYLENDVLIGSTLFPTFVFANTPLFNVYDKDTVLDFTSKIGSLMQIILNAINQPITLESKSLKVPEEKEIILKDIWDQRFFTNNLNNNVFITRLLLIQNELTTCIWLEANLDYNSPNLTFDKYILLRLSSIKLYETMRNLLDLNDRLSIYWDSCKLNKLDYLLVEYKNSFEEEIRKLRNMLHYSNKQINFYDYLQQKITEDRRYPDKMIKCIFNEYIIIIRDAISQAINIQSFESMSDQEKISRRIISLNVKRQ